MRKFGWFVFILFVGIFSLIYYTKKNLDSYTDRAREGSIIHDKKITLSADGQSLKDLHPDWTNLMCDNVASGGITVGMTTDQVNLSLGYKGYKGIPEVNRSVNGNTVREQWVMGGGNYLYFIDGVLTGWQERGR
jgi:hypothetical protein